MQIHRRSFARITGGGALALALPGLALPGLALPGLALPGLARAQAQTLRILVGYAPGGAADVVARAVGDGLRAGGYQVIVENKPGAGGRLAPDALLASPADGTTLLFAPTSVLTIFPHIYRAMRYDALKDFVPVASTNAMAFAIGVGNAIPAKTLADYLALAKADPGKAAYGTPGAGTPMHFLGVMLGRHAKTPLLHVPYKGGAAALTDAIGGTLPAVIATAPALVPMHKAGKLRVLAVSSSAPLASLPGVPTFSSAGYPDLTMSEVFAFFARSGTPATSVAQLNAAITAAVKTPAVSAALEKVDFEPRTMSSAELDKFVRADHARWGEIVKSTGYAPEE